MTIIDMQPAISDIGRNQIIAANEINNLKERLDKLEKFVNQVIFPTVNELIAFDKGGDEND